MERATSPFYYVKGKLMKNKVIIVEGAQGVGKGTITNILNKPARCLY